MNNRAIEALHVSSSAAEIDAVLKRDGCVIILNAMQHTQVDAMLADLAPFIDAKPTGTGNFTGFETKRVHSLFTKTKKVQDFVAHDKVLAMVDLALLPYCQSYTSQSNSITVIGPGESVQPLHRDDMLYPLAHDGERNSVCTAFWALSDFTASNGATRMVPGSHRWGDDREPSEEETVQAIMPKGSVCLFLGGIYHGGGQNSTHDEWRFGMFSAYTLGWLRQEQNFYMAVPPELAKTMPEKVARLVGYSLHRPFLGWIQDIQDPWDVLQGYEELSKGGDDIFADGEERLVQGADIQVGASLNAPVVHTSAPVPTSIQSVESDIGSDELTGILEEDGCVIVRNLIGHNKIGALLEDLKPYLGKKPKGESNFLGYETKRLHSLFAKSAHINDFIAPDFVTRVLDEVLGPYCDTYQLSSNSITAIGPGETPQPLHRGDSLYPLPHPSRRHLGCTAFWALTDFTAENGATRLVPGSHKWDDVRQPLESEAVQAIMPMGSACFFVGATYHGGSPNYTADEWRIAMFTGYILGWLRQEQNFYLTVPPETARHLPEQVARMLGYHVHRPFLGWVADLQDPWDVIQGYEEGSTGGSDLLVDDSTTVVQRADVAVL